MLIENIRNFCIVAHIDHGKSTLADRLLEYTNTIPLSQMRPQILDGMDIERERGITIRSKTIRMNYRTDDGREYILDLIDTPGHVDFSYEISRAMIACEGAILVVDASQGVEAQTLANVFLARKANLKIIPVINKIDLATADIEETKKQIKEILNIDTEPILVSAKEGIGIKEVLNAIITKLPSPKCNPDSNLRAILFDSFYDSYKGVVVYSRVFDGEMRSGMKLTLVSSNRSYELLELGHIQIKMIPCEKLTPGEVGYLIAGIKNIHEVRIGDTIIEKDKVPEKIETHYTEVKPFVFAGLYTINPGEYDNLRTALEKLHLTDASFQYTPVSSHTLGPGFHCGFLGSLHMAIVKERLEREYKVDLILTPPNVVYRVKTIKKEAEIDNPTKFPPYNEIIEIQEPCVKVTIISPVAYLSNVMELCKNHRGNYVEMQQVDANHVIIIFELPLAEIIVGFYDSLKSVSKGYASFDYEHIGYKPGPLVKLEILINNQTIDAFSYIIHESKSQTTGRKVVEKLKELIPRHLFQIPIQAKIKNHIVAREDIAGYRKDVIAKLYGGDVTRKRKLLEKQKDGKKKMKQFGKVEIPQEVFFALVKESL